MPAGCSEHQLALCCDITDKYYATKRDDKVASPTIAWLQEHCAEYGFIHRFPDGKQEIAETVVPPTITDKASFIKAVRESGVVGLGGATFPMSVKFNVKPPAKVDTFIVNGAECEPYITVDHQNMMTHAAEIIAGVKDET